MGEVYEAEQLSMDGRRVAVKMLQEAIGDDHRALGRLRREAKLLCELRHPNTLRVIDFGELDSGALFLVTELLEGEALSTLLDREGRLEPMRAIRIVDQVLRSLGEAHAKGIVHRDVKPDNVYQHEVHGEPDFVKLIDFGIARPPPDETSPRFTAPGLVTGTPAYLSPEQACGREATAQSDLYSVAVMLFELLAGRLPFQYQQTEVLLRAHAAEPPPLVNQDFPVASPALEALIAGCLDKRPSRRPTTAEQLRKALAELPAEPLEQAGAELETVDGALPVADTVEGAPTPFEVPQSGADTRPDTMADDPPDPQPEPEPEPEPEPGPAEGHRALGDRHDGEPEVAEPPPSDRRLIAAVLVLIVVAAAVLVAKWVGPVTPKEAPAPSPTVAEPAGPSPPSMSPEPEPSEPVSPPPTAAVAPAAVDRVGAASVFAPRRRPEPSRVRVVVSARPAGRVTADGVRLGTTPAAVWVPPDGAVKMVVSRHGYVSQKRTVRADSGPVKVELQRSKLPVKYQ